MYASFLLSLLAAFAAMWGKRWLGDDLQSAGKTLIERPHCGERQSKRDESKKWRFWIYIGSPPRLLYFAIVLLVFGVYVNLLTLNTTILFVLAPVIVSGLLYVLASSLGTHPHISILPVVPWMGAGYRPVDALHSIAAPGLYLFGHLSWSLVLTFLRRLGGVSSPSHLGSSMQCFACRDLCGGAVPLACLCQPHIALPRNPCHGHPLSMICGRTYSAKFFARCFVSHRPHPRQPPQAPRKLPRGWSIGPWWRFVG